MSNAAEEPLVAALGALADAFRQLRVPAMIIGGIAVIARGVARSTIDVDGAVWGETLDPAVLVRIMEEHGLVPRIPDALDFARKNHVLLLRHDRSNTPVDISLAWLPFEREALSRATVEDFAGVRVPVVLAEDLVILKAVAWRERDRSDIERLLVLHGTRLDLDRIRSIAREFAEVLEEPDRIEGLELIIRRAMGRSTAP